MKYHLITYGCQMNTADAEEMARPLEQRGIVQTDELREADVVIMNSCTVRQHAEDKAISNLGRLRAWKEQDPNRIVIFAGCAATLWGEKLKKKYSFVDLVSPATKIEQFPDAIKEVLNERWNWTNETNAAFDNIVHPSARLPDNEDVKLFGDPQTAYITIMRGCNYRCSYCIVPQVRGREIYRPINEILDEIRDKTTRGFQEVMLLGQTVNSYYADNPWNGEPTNPVGAARERPGNEISENGPIRKINVDGFNESHVPPGRSRAAPTGLVPAWMDPTRSRLDFADLLRAVNALDGVRTIRFMSPHPKHMRERVIQAMAESAKVSRHVHLPLQSGSDKLLAGMKRLYTREEYAFIVAKLRAAMPGILISTDVIVGYPGETEADLQDTLDFMNEIRFDGLFAFMYSERPGTAAAQHEDDVPEKEKEARLQRIHALNRQIVDGKSAKAS